MQRFECDRGIANIPHDYMAHFFHSWCHDHTLRSPDRSQIDGVNWTQNGFGEVEIQTNLYE